MADDIQWLHCPNCSKKLVQNFGEEGDFEIACNGCYAKIRYTISDGHVSYEFTREPRDKRRSHLPNRHK